MTIFWLIATAVLLIDLAWLGRTLRRGGRPGPAPRSHRPETFAPTRWT